MCVSATSADEGVVNEGACWLEGPCGGTLRAATLVLEGQRLIPAKISFKDRASWPMRGFYDGGPYMIGRLLLLIVEGDTLGSY